MQHREKKLKDHQKRIKHIMQKNTKASLNKSKFKKVQKVSVHKDDYIIKENSILFNKLMDISMGKRSNMTLRSKKSQNITSQSPLHSFPQLRSSRDEQHSLNFVARKREKQRIDSENLKLAAKLVTQKSTLNASKLISQYAQIKMYK